MMSSGRRFGVGVGVLLLVGAMAAPAAGAADGAHVWTRQFGTPQEDWVNGVAVDATGVYTAGHTDGNLKGTNKGSYDGFVRKYDHNGKHLWTRQFGTTAGDEVHAVAVDATGVYAAGHTAGDLKGTNKGERDGFVRKYDPNGKHLWTRQFGTPEWDAVSGVAMDATGVYAAGSTDGDLKGTNKGERDGFVRKYDHDGKHQWTRQFGTGQWDEVHGVAEDATGVYAAGSTEGHLRGVNKGFADGFARKYNNDGRRLWTRQFGTSEWDAVSGVAADTTGVYAAGSTDGDLRGTNKGGGDGFVRKYGTG